MQITTLIPLAGNDGRRFSESRIEKILDALAADFHGCSTDGKVDGRSIEDGHVHRDESLQEVRKRVIKIGKGLGQVTMYFEVRDYDGVQLLPTTPRAVERSRPSAIDLRYLQVTTSVRAAIDEQD